MLMLSDADRNTITTCNNKFNPSARYQKQAKQTECFDCDANPNEPKDITTRQKSTLQRSTEPTAPPQASRYVEPTTRCVSDNPTEPAAAPSPALERGL